MLPIPYEMPKIIAKYINIYLKIDSIVTRSLIAPGPDHAAEGANDASRAASLHLFIGDMQRHGRLSRTLTTRLYGR